MPGGLDVDTSAIYGKNIGLNKEVYFSSEENGFEAKKVNDGDNNSSWKPVEGENQWITIDLGENRNILGVKLDWNAPNKSKNYLLQTSIDNEDWIILYSGNDNKFTDKELFKFELYGIYIRVLLQGKSDAYSQLCELTVYGNEDNGGDLVEDEERVNVALGKEAFASSNIEGREPNKAIDGDIYKYNLYVSEDGENFNLVKENGIFSKDKTEKTIKFNQSKGRFVKLEVLDSYGGHASAAEINIYKALVDGINIETTVGIKPNLPNEVQVTLDSENKKVGIAIWEEIDKELYEKEGKFTVKGIIKITANVKVIKEDKEQLKIAIDEAKDLSNNSIEGFYEGNYHKGSKNELNKSLELAKDVYADKEATKSDIEKTIEELNNAIERFNLLQIDKWTGDLNKNNKFDIGDLLIISKFYGIQEINNEEWDKVKEFDLNKDGEINGYELEFITFKILN